MLVQVPGQLATPIISTVNKCTLNGIVLIMSAAVCEDQGRMASVACVTM